MSKTVINKRDQIKWDNGFDPNGKSIPDITESDEGKFIKVVDGVLAFGEGGGSGSTYTAGDNIQISADNVISATDTTYTAGTNVSISNENVISATNTTYTAGTNISISAQNVISATDTTYSAGTGISIDGSNVISADSQLPTVSSADEGKVLKVDSNGDWSVGTDNDTTYSAGEGIEISAQVVSSPDAVMAKESIADDFQGITFYKVPTDYTGIGLNKGFVRFYTQKGELNKDWIYLPYSSTVEAYIAIVDSYTQWGQTYNQKAIIVFAPNVTAGYTTNVGIATYRVSDGQTSTPAPINLTESYSGTEGTGAYGLYTIDQGSRMEEVSYDLSNCEFSSDVEAVNTFANNPVPTGYSEGDQVWKDGKLQTYTSGAWVDSDPIVEQIANAGGGGSETWTLIYTNQSAFWSWGDWRDVVPGSEAITPATWNSYKKIVVEFTGSTQTAVYPKTNWLRENNNGSTEYPTSKKVVGTRNPLTNVWTFDTLAVVGKDHDGDWSAGSVSCYFEPKGGGTVWQLSVRFSELVKLTTGVGQNSITSVWGDVNVYGIK